jgi:hypothetical protein
MLLEGLKKDKYCLTSSFRYSMLEHDDTNFLDIDDAEGNMGGLYEII